MNGAATITERLSQAPADIPDLHPSRADRFSPLTITARHIDSNLFSHHISPRHGDKSENSRRLYSGGRRYRMVAINACA